MSFKEIGDKLKCIWFNFENLKENEIHRYGYMCFEFKLSFVNHLFVITE